MSENQTPPTAEPRAPTLAAVLVENRRQFLAFLERRVGDRATAEDILQDAFVRGLNKFDTLRSDESAVAWFYRLLRNALIDYRRRNGAAERKLSAFGAELEQSTQPDVEMHRAICHCVGELATTLKDEYADALRAIEIDGITVKDFAQLARISPSNAGVRIFRAREALRKQVVRSCGACADHGCQDCTCARPTRAAETNQPRQCGHS
jgi:RNA polymerase sigma factor (sigma-70 family)